MVRATLGSALLSDRLHHYHEEDFRREEPVIHEGKEISLPYSGDGAMGVGKPLKSFAHESVYPYLARDGDGIHC